MPRLSSAVLLVAALLPGSHFVNALTTDLVALDIFSNPKHQVVYGTYPGHLPITPATLATIDFDSNPSLLLLPDASTGKRYLCHVPAPQEVVVEKPSPEAEEKHLLLQRAFKLLEPMATRDCLYYIHNWWTYEFCHNRHVRQFHQRTKEEELANPDQKQDYILGRFPAAALAASLDERPADAAGKKGTTGKELEEPKGATGGAPAGAHQSQTGGGAEGAKQNTAASILSADLLEHEVDGKIVTYLKEVWGDGTVCEVGTAGPRSIEIQYHCNPYVEQISSIRETGSCRYVIHIQTMRLCTDPAFHPKQVDKGTSIVCEPVLSTELLEAMTSSRQYRETYAPPGAFTSPPTQTGAFNPLHPQINAGSATPKGLLGIRDFLSIEYTAKAAARGLSAPPPRGQHSIEAIMEKLHRRKTAAGVSQGTAPPQAGQASAPVTTISLKELANAAAAAAAAAMGVGDDAGAGAAAGDGGLFDLSDPAVAEMLRSDSFSSLLKKVSHAVAEALGDELAEGDRAAEAGAPDAPPANAAPAGAGKAAGQAARNQKVVFNLANLGAGGVAAGGAAEQDGIAEAFQQALRLAAAALNDDGAEAGRDAAGAAGAAAGAGGAQAAGRPKIIVTEDGRIIFKDAASEQHQQQQGGGKKRLVPGGKKAGAPKATVLKVRLKGPGEAQQQQPIVAEQRSPDDDDDE
ncbi:hypothetical protein HDU96_009662 [Phlyctochytrium bullatum]|nr:hypothetical protein HDU96_009662 [Phlyctochytrium bullatum]